MLNVNTLLFLLVAALSVTQAQQRAAPVGESLKTFQNPSLKRDGREGVIIKDGTLPMPLIFAHNDYVQPIPFYTAYVEEVDFIEADIFLYKNDLQIAHEQKDIEQQRTLDNLYLKPLHEKITKHQGFVYADHSKMLTLVIDLKTDGVPTLNALVKKLKNYPTLLACKTLQISVSGNVPNYAQWKDYPPFIHFDGRPGMAYSDNALARITMVSASFKDFAQWNGKGIPTASEREKIFAVIKAVHANKKKIRFWASPDFLNAWLVLMDIGVDIICTDHVVEVSKFLKNKTKNTFQQHSPYSVYVPKYNHTKKTSQPKNIILMIGDGMGLAQLYSGYTANHGNLNIFTIQDIGFSVTTSSDSYSTDSAAGATAMATGSKTKNRFIGIDSLGNRLESINDKLKNRGFYTAIISAGDITDATPAAFYAHQPDRGLNEAIANDFLATQNDILIGGGLNFFNNRSDKKDLTIDLGQRGYTVSTSFASIDTIRNKKFVLLDDAAVVSKMQGRKDFLTKSIVKSIETFQHKAPFFIMAEGAQIDYGGHSNDLQYVVREVLDFDQAVGEAMKFVDQDGETLLIITADHETGGLTLPGGDIRTGNVYGNFSTNDHTAIMVPVFSYGPGADNFKGVYQNTELNVKILNLLGIK